MVSNAPFCCKLNSGHTIPALGLGTWLSKPGEVGQAVHDAIDIGYRHFDCAMVYGNQPEIGKTFSESFSNGKIKRADMFVTTKIWNTFHSYQKASEAVDICLKDLQLPYLDMLLIHWPMAYIENGEMFPKDENGKMIYSNEDYLNTWKAMEDAVSSGKIKSIGLSNFSREQMERIMKECRIKPSNLQVEAHPYFPQNNVVEWCKRNDIILTAYSPLANNTHLFRKEGQPNLLNEPILTTIGQKHSKTPAQIAIRWALQRNTSVIPKSTSKTRLSENFNVWNFSLSKDEMTQIDSLDRNWRIATLERDVSHPFYPFHTNY